MVTNTEWLCSQKATQQQLAESIREAKHLQGLYASEGIGTIF